MLRYFSFNGLAMRSEYWGVYVIATLLVGVLLIVGSVLVDAVELLGIAVVVAAATAAATAYVWLALAVTVRRCRDAGINVWWTLATIVPYVGLAVAIVIGVLNTDETVRRIRD